MTRFACLLILAAGVILVNLSLYTTGPSAIWFSFVGVPALTVGVAIYGFGRWRQGAFRNEGRTLNRKETIMRSLTLVLSIALGLTAPTSLALAEDGTAIFAAQCAKCHGADGKADTAAGKALKVPALAGNAKVAAMSVDDIQARIKSNGKHEAILPNLTAEDIKATAEVAKNLAAGK